MISFDAFQDELEKIADGMSVKKITDAGKNVAMNIARAPAEHMDAIKGRLGRMTSPSHSARMGSYMDKRLTRAKALSSAGARPFSPPGQAMLTESKRLKDSVTSLNNARQQVHNTASSAFRGAR
jgi:hypothetical protein